MARRNRGLLRWLAKHPILVLSVLLAGWCSHRFGSPVWAAVGLLPAPTWHVAGLGLRRISPRSPLHAKPTSVYGFHDNTGTLVYVGITVTGREQKRWAEHAETKPWWPQVARKEILHRYPDRYKALTREALLIRKHRPRRNIMHNRVQGWRALIHPAYLLRLGKYNDPRRRRDALETAVVLSWRYRAELWLYEHGTKLNERRRKKQLMNDNRGIRYNVTILTAGQSSETKP